MQKERGRAMGDAFGVHRVDKAEIVNVLVHFRKQVGRPAAGLALLRKLPNMSPISCRTLKHVYVVSKKS